MTDDPQTDSMNAPLTYVQKWMIGLGVAFFVIGLLGVSSLVVWYIKRKRATYQHVPLSDEDVDILQ